MRLTIVLLFGLWSTLSWGAQEVDSDLREPIFSDAQAALAKANKAKGFLLAPDNYAEASDAYRRAEQTFKDGGKLERIQNYLQKAEELFEASAEFAAKNVDVLQSAYSAREDAEKAGAKEHASDLWQDAEENLYEAATRLEAGREKSVARFQEKADKKFREAELAAIEVSLLTETETQIKAARDVDADDLAPRSYVQAVSLLEQARQSLAEDRYDTDRPRGLATEALHHAKHAKQISQLWARIDDDELTFEDAIGVWESEVRNLATLLDLAVFFDNGPGEASAAIGDSITELQLRMGQLQLSLSEQERHTALLEEEVTRLQAELGGQSRARDRLQNELARQQRLKDRVSRVESLFRPDEAQVVRVEDRLVLRLLALNFGSGKADVVREHEAVLGKLMEALSAFPETPVIVEGHTDAYGADLSNLDLSNRRAEAVAQYLLDNSPLSPALLSSIGYGESKPIANNETADGRRKNRRIDVVLYPSW